MDSKFILLFTLFRIICCSLSGQEFDLSLYNGIIPNSKPSSIAEKIEKGDYTKITNVSVPDIKVYLPTKQFASGQCVIICPGGGYTQLSYDLEGTDIARYLNSIGVAAVVLKYRLPSKEYCIEPHKAPLMDAQRAMRLVRYNATKWNIAPDKIGIMGFSAGGHLASTLGTHFDYGNKTSQDSVENQSCRPDFMILLYAAVSIHDSTTLKRRKVLLGENPDKELIAFYSNDLQVKDDTPPAFFAFAFDDEIPAEGTLLMYKALRAKRIPTELHIYSEGGHGFGLAANNDHVNSWTNSLKLWLKSLNKTD